jgi:hypothetical protein
MSVATDAGGVNRGDAGCGDEDVGCSFDEVIRQVFGMTQGCVSQPEMAEPMREIGDGVVMSIGDDREQISLHAYDGGGWALGRPALANLDPDLQRRARVALTKATPRLFRHSKNSFFVGEDFDSKAEWIEDGSEWEGQVEGNSCIAGS